MQSASGTARNAIGHAVDAVRRVGWRKHQRIKPFVVPVTKRVGLRPRERNGLRDIGIECERVARFLEDRRQKQECRSQEKAGADD